MEIPIKQNSSSKLDKLKGELEHLLQKWKKLSINDISSGQNLGIVSVQAMKKVGGHQRCRVWVSSPTGGGLDHVVLYHQGQVSKPVFL